jgi:uncharacterized SAM-binding protein YcdF (DUF218 family)
VRYVSTMSIFYLLSKTTGFFLIPANWIIILIIISLLIKRRSFKKKLLIAAAVLFIVFSNRALFRLAANAWQPPKTHLNGGTNYSAGILLGGLSQADKNGNGYFTESADRFIQTVQLYHTGRIKKVVITGAGSEKEGPAEGEYLAPELMKAGVKEEDILIEPQALNTYENAVFSKRILDSLQLEAPHVVITSAIHVPRAKQVFVHAGMNVIMYPSNYLAVEKSPSISDMLLPNMKALDDWRYLIKEVIGTWAYRLTSKA